MTIQQVNKLIILILSITILILFNSISVYAQRSIRVISLAPDLTEIIFAIKANKQLVGVIKGCDYPVAAQALPIVGSYTGLDLEKIISLHPNLILRWGDTFPREMAVLEKMGIPIYTSDPHDLKDVPAIIKKLGELTGHTVEANKQAQSFSYRLNQLRKQYQSQQPITVFYQIGDYSLITINHDSWINQVIRLCGGKNVFADAKLAAPEIAWEALITANPQAIISDAVFADWKKRFSKWPTMSAVKQNNLFDIDPDIIERAGPRLIQGAAKICEYLQQARQKI